MKYLILACAVLFATVAYNQTTLTAQQMSLRGGACSCAAVTALCTYQAPSAVGAACGVNIVCITGCNTVGPGDSNRCVGNEPTDCTVFAPTCPIDARICQYYVPSSTYPNGGYYCASVTTTKKLCGTYRFCNLVP